MNRKSIAVGIAVVAFAVAAFVAPASQPQPNKVSLDQIQTTSVHVDQDASAKPTRGSWFVEMVLPVRETVN